MTCWIFDLDGVVTDIQEKKIAHPQLLDYFVKILQQNEPLTLNTGRGIPFIHQEVFSPLLEQLAKRHLPASLLNNFFAVGEKGNAWIENEEDCFDMSSAIPEDFARKVKELVEKDFHAAMFFDTTKRTMISIEMHTGMSIAAFAPYQKRLIPQLEDMLKKASLETSYKLDPSISATDIEHKNAGKLTGTKRILEWLDKGNMHPDHFVAFGDSVADMGTGEELAKKGKDFTFVFVGDPTLLKQPSFPITFTKQQYDKGVVEYLASCSFLT